MWKPVSSLEYVPLNPKGQLIVISCPMEKRDDKVQARWKDQACAMLSDSAQNIRDVVRDLLANPQVRGIVFDGPACGRDAYDAFWLGTTDPGFRIDMEHIALVRQFVDLWDDDCATKGPMQPFWPARVMYLDETKEK